jgi:CheY-like chemotaxis protein
MMINVQTPSRERWKSLDIGAPVSGGTLPREVMVVDDDADVRCALVEFLAHHGISAFHAFDGLDALERIRAGCKPCSIVLDVDMPRLDGPALVAALRVDPMLPKIPVVTMTAGVQPAGLNTDGHLQKPFDVEALRAALFGICRSCGVCDGDGPVVGSVFAARQRADLAAELRSRRLVATSRFIDEIVGERNRR